MDYEGRKSGAIQWMVQGDSYQACSQTVPELPAGAYTVGSDCYGAPVFKARQVKADDLIEFPDSLPTKILREVERFWQLGDRFREHGFLHRRGYLLYGKQGCGKSSLVHQVVRSIVDEGHVAFFCENPYELIHGMDQFRIVEPERPIVCIFEDIDAIINRYGDSELLQWLDGNHQIDKGINIATTNYPENLDRRILARPRRFDRVMRISSPDERLRGAYFRRKLPKQSEEERRVWVRLTAGLTFAALAELIISVYCLGHELEQAVDLLKQLDGHAPSSHDFLKDEIEEEALPV